MRKRSCPNSSNCSTKGPVLSFNSKSAYAGSEDVRRSFGARDLRAARRFWFFSPDKKKSLVEKAPEDHLAEQRKV